MGTVVIGLTGGVGMGKSTAAALLRERGVPVVDTDDLAREEVRPGSEGLAAVVAQFGTQYLDAAGGLRRAALGELVFQDPAARLALEAILHPRIQRRWLAQISEWREGKVSCGCVVIPLLFEKDYASAFDAVVAVACSVPTQAVRIASRGWDLDELRRREAVQWSAERKLALARFGIWTEGSLESHRRQWARVLDTIRG
jgi:dephospho-CoA kinase